MNFPTRRLRLASLVCVIYFTVSGGAFGIEPLVGAVGPGLAVLLIVVTPFVWSLPMALMVAELATLLPEEGGYYIWVKESLGDFWAVQEAWWTMAERGDISTVTPFPGCSVGRVDPQDLCLTRGSLRVD